VIYVAVVIASFVALPGLVASVADPSLRYVPTRVRGFRSRLWLSLSFVVAFAGGIWWAMLGVLLARFARAVQLLFWPFADWFEQRHGIGIAVVGAGLAIVAAAGLSAVVWIW
jgi:hypothetical protein